jgi:hypothetical protein
LTVNVDDYDPFVILAVREVTIQLTRDECRTVSDALRAAAVREVGTITFLTSRENRTVAREVLGGIAMARRPAERALRQLEGEMRRRVESGAEGTLFRPARGVDGEGIWIDQRRRVLLEKAESVVLSDPSLNHEGQVPARIEYMRRTGLPVTGDPARGQVRTARQF